MLKRTEESELAQAGGGERPIEDELPSMSSEIGSKRLEHAAGAAGFGSALSRRQFLFVSGGAITGLAALSICRAWGADAPVVIIDNATGLLLADSSRCVGCQRCELACTEFNDGRAQPSLARIKVSRNIDFGPEGPAGAPGIHGAWRSGLVIQDTCRQCPHPVPCATSCPKDAIRADPGTGARVINTAECIGCRLCLHACPWNMISFDEESQKATKCFLCQGNPKCVEACPSGALRYVPWRDTTREAGRRAAILSVISTEEAKECLDCHLSR